MIKLGKEMKLSLDKLVTYKVENPNFWLGVTWLFTNAYKYVGLDATLVKMDILYNGQCRMIEIRTFFQVRDTIDDIMFIPSIMQKLDQAWVSKKQKSFERYSNPLFKANHSCYHWQGLQGTSKGSL